MDSFDILSIESTLIDRILNKTSFLDLLILSETCLSLADKCSDISKKNFVLESLQVTQNEVLLVAPDQRQVSISLSETIPASLVASTIKLGVTVTVLKCEEILNFFKPITFKYESLTVNSYYLPECLADLIEKLKIKRLVMNVMLLRKLCDFASFKNVESIVLQEHDLSDEDLLCLNASSISLNCCCLSPKIVNSLLKEWLSQHRSLHFLGIRNISFIPYQKIETILEDITSYIIWTPENHKQSQFAHIPLDDLPCMQRLDPLFVFSVPRDKDSYGLLLLLTNDSIEIVDYSQKKEVLERYGFPIKN